MNRNEIETAIAALRYYDIVALAREVKGGTLGFDVNRRFAGGGSKARMAQWMMQEPWADTDKLEAALPAFVKSTREYYAKRGKAVPEARSEEMTAAGETSWMTAADEAKLDDVKLDDVKLADAADILAKALAAAMVEDQKVLNGCNKTLKDIGEAFAALKVDVARLDKMRQIVVTVKNGTLETTTTTMGQQHKSFNLLLKLAATRDMRGNGLNLWMTGPAGSGKTTAAENVAKALNMPFLFTGAVDNEFKLLGFVDATGKTIRTAFREAYEHGGIFLLDEVDGCHPSALLALNAALANGHCDFPDGNVARHKDCVIMAAANTWGGGATHEYVGRAKLDAASVDRFTMLAWDYDEELERNVSGDLAWATKVQRIRANIQRAGIKHIVSPRATYDGAALLAAGFTEEEVLTMKVRKGLNDSDWMQVAR